ncbi:hypothetical protein KJ836_02760 [Patescibacteria group bacterium]|nr:hypothetical protein [Patescibacteria group bacterium]
MAVKAKCFICGKVGSEATYFWWQKRGWSHMSCAIDCDFSINHDTGNKLNKALVDKLVTDKDIDTLKKKPGYLNYLVFKVYTVSPMDRKSIADYILSKTK